MVQIFLTSKERKIVRDKFGVSNVSLSHYLKFQRNNKMASKVRMYAMTRLYGRLATFSKI